MAPAEKTPEDILKEELQRERAVVLGRAGESVQKALDKLKAAETAINALTESLHSCSATAGNAGRRRAVKEINEQIHQYNRLRDYAKLRYYYLVVTREAMGLRRHHWVEKTYPIPPKKRTLVE